MTVFSACILWPLGRAIRRGRAIDAIKSVGIVKYLDGPFAQDNHFWLDLKQVPVCIYVHSRFDDATALHIIAAKPIKHLKVFLPDGALADTAVVKLTDINDGCQMVFRAPVSMSNTPFDELKEALPRSKIEVTRDSDSFGSSTWDVLIP